MLSTLKLKSVAIAAGAVVAMAAAAPANAYVYAMSHLDIQNLVLDVTNAATNINSFTFNLNNSASLNGAPVVAGAACNSFNAPACSAVSPALDAAAVNAPGSTLNRINNNFAFLGADNSNSYSGADTVVTTAELVQGVPTNISQIAESLLNTNGFAAANALIQSNTSLGATVNVSGTGGLTLNFKADPDQRSEISGAIGNYLSQSDLNSSFSLTGNGGTISWTPNGTAANDCVVTGFVGVTCVENADGADLNFNTTASVNPSSSDNSYDPGAVFSNFGIVVAGLVTGTYQIAFNAQTSTSIIRQVPEPGSVGLVGAALLGLALTSVRRRKSR